MNLSVNIHIAHSLSTFGGFLSNCKKVTIIKSRVIYSASYFFDRPLRHARKRDLMAKEE